jgi:hypothetical protein
VPDVAGEAKAGSDRIRYTAEALADEVTALPGLKGQLAFRHFSGYLAITDTKRIFYWSVPNRITFLGVWL